MSDDSAAGIVAFLRLAEQLKLRKRTGWVLRGVCEVESIADHMYRMALAALVLPVTDSDSATPDAGGGASAADATASARGDAAMSLRIRVACMALVHDVAEAVVGDIVPGAMSKAEKHALERAALADMTAGLPPDTAGYIQRLCEEYDAGSSTAARLCKDLDKLDMLLTALAYQARQPAAIDLRDFWASCEGKFTTQAGRALAAQAYALREEQVAQAAAGTLALQWHGRPEPSVAAAAASPSASSASSSSSSSSVVWRERAVWFGLGAVAAVAAVAAVLAAQAARRR